MRMGFSEKGTKGTQARSDRCRGLTRFDVLAIVLLTILLFLMAFSVLTAPRQRDKQINCVANLRQITVATRIWENDTGPGTAPLEPKDQTIGFKEANGLNSGQIAWINAIGISNIVGLSKELQCPADIETPITTNAAGLKIRISYFLNLDANEGYPQEILSGDDNLAASGAPVKPGVIEISLNTPISWAAGRHGRVNNISFADGSVDEVSQSMLKSMTSNSFNGTPLFTNRFAIP